MTLGRREDWGESNAIDAFWTFRTEAVRMVWLRQIGRSHAVNAGFEVVELGIYAL
jgi:hypothetical protein